MSNVLEGFLHVMNCKRQGRKASLASKDTQATTEVRVTPEYKSVSVPTVQANVASCLHILKVTRLNLGRGTNYQD